MSGYNYPHPLRDEQNSGPYATRGGERGSASPISSSTLGRDYQQASAGYGTGDVYGGSTSGRTDVPHSLGYGGASGTGREFPQSAGYSSQPSTEFQPMCVSYPAATTGTGGGIVSADRPLPPARTVMVDILEGRNLLNVELIGKVDPYCLLLVGSDKIKTRVHKDAGTNLTFNDTAELAVVTEVDEMLLEVWDYNHVRGDRMEKGAFWVMLEQV
ncbi:hypothetical protein AMAG_02662 [Allomyces macrogynus ATCC 38327]|uniref:C2 domain-containing protein n=1 Tax=Allomyces macrogynus (strain ATCC 38327) TaxID=578462 RepID=A0A0L0S398_ALLM3|nr:hypothetical protein AMAG_02662 [Allomyces macrogynus ATCC 38327]|eukprot:KNE56891.1 hypothetical protein AMAG_02662 [Allomyces macrogynus ATCC 38327]